MIYVIGTPGAAVVKIGLTNAPLTERLSALQIGNPLPLAVLWNVEGDRALEDHLHATFHEYRIRGEWFDLEPLGDAVAAVQKAVSEADTAAMLKAPHFRARPVVPPSVTSPPARLLPVYSVWEQRFPAPRKPVEMTPSCDYTPKPQCERNWQGKCRRPAGTTGCDACTDC